MAGLITSVSGWLGFGEENEQAPTRPTPGAAERTPNVAKITQLHKRRSNTEQPNEIFSIEPDSYLGSGEEIASYYREGVTVIVNMAKLSDAESLRMVDYGHAFAVVAPVHVGINDPEPAEDVVDGLLIRP
jgi:FtsZ-interacting cell division protein YlmF